MASRYPNPCRAKLHRNYTIPEAAQVLGVHKNTIARWIKNQGLDAITDKKPFLIRGDILRAFLTVKRTKDRVTCPPGHLFCLGCRAPREPAGQIAEYRLRTPTYGNLGAACSSCDAWMNRVTRLADLPVFERFFEVLRTEA